MTEWLCRDVHTLALCYSLFINDKAFQKELKRLGVKGEVAFQKHTHSFATVHFFESNGKQVALVCMPLKDAITSVQYYACLVHEAVHIWQRHCELIGEVSPSSEMEAYAVQTISQELMLSFDKLTKKGRKK
jgi:hypothetical protein